MEMKIIAAQFYMRHNALNEEAIEDLLKKTQASPTVCAQLLNSSNNQNLKAHDEWGDVLTMELPAFDQSGNVKR